MKTLICFGCFVAALIVPVPAGTAEVRCADTNKVVALGDGACNTRRTCCNQRGECYCC